MATNSIFKSRCNIAPDYFGNIEKFGQYVQEIELTPLRIIGEDYEWYPPKPNAYGIYLRYTDEGQQEMNLSPSEWIADFSDKETAESFKTLAIRLLTAHMSELEKEKLFFKLLEN